MRGFQDVVVPLDFSDLTDTTLEIARRVVAPGGRVTLLNVVEWLPSVTGSALGVYPHRKDIEQLMTMARARLEALAERLGEAEVAVEVREGRAAATIMETVADLGPDLIVIGSHGRTGLDHLLLGSVTERVLRKATMPVLVVRRPPRDEA